MRGYGEPADESQSKTHKGRRGSSGSFDGGVPARLLNVGMPGFPVHVPTSRNKTIVRGRQRIDKDRRDRLRSKRWHVAFDMINQRSLAPALGALLAVAIFPFVSIPHPLRTFALNQCPPCQKSHQLHPTFSISGEWRFPLSLKSS